MAIFMLSARKITRQPKAVAPGAVRIDAKGQPVRQRSILAAAAYRSGTALTDSRTGQVHDFSPRAKSIEVSEIFVPLAFCEWSEDRQKLWQCADDAEKRKDAVLGREFVAAIPHELDKQQRRALVAGFAKAIVEQHGIAVDVALHKPEKRGDDRNYHAHILLSTRRLEQSGFGEKAREWDVNGKRPVVDFWREQWAAHCNFALEMAGEAARVDHRSLKAQGIRLLPKIHLGADDAELERQGTQTMRGDSNRRIDRLNDRISTIFSVESWAFKGFSPWDCVRWKPAENAKARENKAAAEAKKLAEILPPVVEWRPRPRHAVRTVVSEPEPPKVAARLAVVFEQVKAEREAREAAEKAKLAAAMEPRPLTREQLFEPMPKFEDMHRALLKFAAENKQTPFDKLLQEKIAQPISPETLIGRDSSHSSDVGASSAPTTRPEPPKSEPTQSKEEDSDYNMDP